MEEILIIYKEQIILLSFSKYFGQIISCLIKLILGQELINITLQLIKDVMMYQTKIQCIKILELIKVLQHHQ